MDSQPTGHMQCQDITSGRPATDAPISAPLPPVLKWRLRQDCDAKRFTIQPVEAPAPPPVPTHRPPVAIDLVVLVDTSDSMADEVRVDEHDSAQDIAEKLCGIVASAVQEAQDQCQANLRVQWLGIEGGWSGTPVTVSYRHYLTALGVAETALTGRRRGTLKHQGAQEDGARAIVDLAHHFDWRPGAMRLILFLGDEALEGGNPTDAIDRSATENAIAAAKACAVRIFGYCGTGEDGRTPDVTTYYQYLRLVTATGGCLYSAPRQNLRRFRKDLAQILCNLPADDGPLVSLPTVRPCFELHWGDGPHDQMETSDQETLCLGVRNPYPNVIFHELTIVRSALTTVAGGAVPTLPDGTPTITVTPTRQIAFGDLVVHRSDGANAASSQTREMTLVSRGAAAGDYLLTIHYRCHAEIVLQTSDDFEIQLVAS